MQPDHDRITQLCAETTVFLRRTLIEMAEAGATPSMLYNIIESMRNLHMANVDDCNGMMNSHGMMLGSAATIRPLSVQTLMPEEAAHVFKEMEGMLQLLRSHYPLPRTEDDSEPKA